jgi:hypothetical protein
VLAATAALGAAVLTVPQASAQSVRVNDDEPGMEASFLAIKSARFTNAKNGATVKVMHPTLQMEHVDYIRLVIFVGKIKENPLYAASYEASWKRGKGVIYKRDLPGDRYGPRKFPCKGAKVVRNEDKGFVRVHVPSRCLRTTAKSHEMKMGYSIANGDYFVYDVVPGTNQNWGVTRWLKRG